MKYKELRIMLVLLTIFVGSNIELVISISNGNKRNIIFSVLIAFSALWMSIGRANHKIGDNYLLIYEYKIIGILPTLINFEDIQNVSATKHIVTIEYLKKNKNHKSKAYMLMAKKFEKELQEKRKKYQEKGSNQ